MDLLREVEVFVKDHLGYVELPVLKVSYCKLVANEKIWNEEPCSWCQLPLVLNPKEDFELWRQKNFIEIIEKTVGCREEDVAANLGRKEKNKEISNTAELFVCCVMATWMPVSVSIVLKMP